MNNTVELFFCRIQMNQSKTRAGRNMHFNLNVKMFYERVIT